MSYFHNQRETVRVPLPTDNNLWVEVYSKFTWAEEKLIGDARSNGETTADAILGCMVVAWNLTEEDGSVAPIDQVHLDQLDRIDAVAIIDKIQGLMIAPLEDAAAKKASSPKSPKR